MRFQRRACGSGRSTSGRREEEKGLNRTEFRYGALQRSVRLPGNAEESKIKAGYHKGILEITVPLTAPQPEGRKIEIVVK